MRKFSAIDPEAMGNILKIYRVSNRMTQQRVADYLGIARSTYAKYETMRTPELDVVMKLSVLYNTSLDDFLNPLFNEDTSAVAAASSPDSGNEAQVVTSAEKKLLEYYRGSVRKAEILKAAEQIFNADIEIINDIQD
ncbi:MAG: helix-turn-helix transcriptional regulator [Clostridia bacterium]|nr:helix-turn-helix transcriptional regulator [Clostridia bacterium]